VLEKGGMFGPSWSNHWVKVEICVPEHLRGVGQPLICEYGSSRLARGKERLGLAYGKLRMAVSLDSGGEPRMKLTNSRVRPILRSLDLLRRRHTPTRYVPLYLYLRLALERPGRY
jgi:hypothetical protein